MRYYTYSFDWLHGVVSICRSGDDGEGGTVIVIPQKVRDYNRIDPIDYRCILSVFYITKNED